MRKNILQLSLALLAVSFALVSCGSKKAQDQEEETQEMTQEEEAQEMPSQEEAEEAPVDGDSAQSMSQGDSHEGHEHAAAYQCHAKCEKDKTYAAKGKCPRCNMDLDAVSV